MQSVPVEERVTQINNELAEFKQRLDRAETVYNDETRMRQIVEGIVQPIILLAKQNALTNCYKNDELQFAREDMKEINEKMLQFRKQLDVIHEYEQKMVRTEERINNEITKANKSFEPTRKMSVQCRDEVTEIKSKVKEIKLTLQQREQRLIDLENLFIEHQKETREDVMNRVQRNIDVIEQMHPKIQHITNLSTECAQYYNTTKEEFAEIHQKVQDNYTFVATLQNELDDIKNARLKDMKRQLLNNNTQVQELFKQMTNANLRMTQLDDGCNQLRKQIQDLSQFALFQQPVLTHSQISDVLQEFLCIPDQMKLIEFDNQKLDQIDKFRDKFAAGNNVSLNIQKVSNQLKRMEQIMRKSENGCVRINFEKDMQFSEANSHEREQQMKDDLQSKGDLIKKIYKFEKQMFLAQGKLDGLIPQTQDLVDETLMRDNKGHAQQRAQRGEALEQMDLINLQDPNHRLKQFIRYQNQSNLAAVQLANDRIQKEKNEVRHQQEEPGAATSAAVSDKVSQQSGRSKNQPLVGVGLVEKQVASEKETVDEKQEDLGANALLAVQGPQIPPAANAQGLTVEERRSLAHRLANPQLKGHPDFHLLPEQNCCSRCGLRNRRFGNIPNNNHMHGSGMQNVIYEVVFVRSQTKIDRMQHRFLAKKRNWLTRQIDPSKRYLHALNKQAKIREIQQQENLEFGDEEYGGTMTMDTGNHATFLDVDGHVRDDQEHDDHGDRQDDSVDRARLLGLPDQESQHTVTDDQQLDEDKDSKSSPRTVQQHMHIESNDNSVSTLLSKTPINKLQLHEVEEEKEQRFAKGKALENKKPSTRRIKGHDLADSKRTKTTRGAGAKDKEGHGSTSNSQRMPAASADSKGSDSKSTFDRGKQDRARFAKAQGLKTAQAAGGQHGDPRLVSKMKQVGPTGAHSSAGGAADKQQRQASYDMKKMQQYMQQQLLKLKGQMEQNTLSNVSAVQSAFQAKLANLTQRTDQLQKVQAEHKQLTDLALAKNFEILEKRMIKLEHNHDYLDELLKQMQEKYDAILEKQNESIEKFKKYVSDEYVDFFKNRRRIKMELFEHSKEYKNKFQVLAGLCNEFSFKFNYMDAIVPVLAEQNRFTYNILLQDMSVREVLSKTLSQAQTPAHNGYLLLEQIRASQSGAKVDHIGKELLNLQAQIHQLTLNQNSRQELETTKATVGGFAQVLAPPSGTATQLSSPGPRKYGTQVRQPSLSLEEMEQPQPSPSGPTADNKASQEPNLDKRNSANTGSLKDLRQQTLKTKQHALQYIAPHKELLPDEYFKKRLNSKNSGLYLQLLTYRSQKVDQHQFKQYLDAMSEKVELLLENIVPFGSSWSNKKLEDRMTKQLPSKKLFDDIHFGKDVLSDARNVESLSIEKICDQLLKIDIQDQDFPQNYLNFYVNETVPRSAEKTTGRAQSSYGPKRTLQGYQTQSPQTLQNETLKSDQSNKELDLDALVADANISSKGVSILKNRMKSGQRSDKQLIIKPTRSQSSNPKIAEQANRGGTRLQKTQSERSNINEKRTNNTASKSAPGTAIPGKRNANTSLQKVKAQENAGNQPFAKLSRPFQMNMEAKATSPAPQEADLVDRKTSTILSQDNLRSQKILDDLNKLPRKVMQHAVYQQQTKKTLSSRQSISAQALQHLNRTTPFYYTAGDYQTQAASATKTLINKVADPKQRVAQQTPVGSSTSTEMRYLSAKSNPNASLRQQGASRNIPLHGNSKTQTLGKMSALKITIQQHVTGADSAAEPFPALQKRRSDALAQSTKGPR